MMRRLALIAALLAPPAAAESIVAGLSDSAVAITTDFSGSEIMVFGAVKREAPLRSDAPLRVIVTVEGPDTPLTLRRKDHRFGIWMNSASVKLPAVPSFFALASSAPLDQALAPYEDARLGITLPRRLQDLGLMDGLAPDQAFQSALIRIRQGESRFQVKEGAIAFTEQTLFRTDISLPAALVEGNYKVRIYLTRDGRVVDDVQRVIWVRKAGLERFLHRAAQDQPLLYGLAALLIAALAGWGASALFARLRW